MSNTTTQTDFYQVPNLSFDINKLRSALESILKNSKYQTLGITNFHAIPMNKIPGNDDSVKVHFLYCQLLEWILNEFYNNEKNEISS